MYLVSFMLHIREIDLFYLVGVLGQWCSSLWMFPGLFQGLCEVEAPLMLNPGHVLIYSDICILGGVQVVKNSSLVLTKQYPNEGLMLLATRHLLAYFGCCFKIG